MNAEAPPKRKNRPGRLIITILAAVGVFIIGLACFAYGAISAFSLGFYGGGPCTSGEFIHLEWVSDGSAFRTYERFECVNNEVRWESHVLTTSGEVLETEPGVQAPNHIARLVSEDNNIEVDTDGQYVYVSEGNKRGKMIYELYPGRRKALRGSVLVPVGVLLMAAGPVGALIALIINRRTAG